MILGGQDREVGVGKFGTTVTVFKLVVAPAVLEGSCVVLGPCELSTCV